MRKFSYQFFLFAVSAVMILCCIVGCSVAPLGGDTDKPDEMSWTDTFSVIKVEDKTLDLRESTIADLKEFGFKNTHDSGFFGWLQQLADGMLEAGKSKTVEMTLDEFVTIKVEVSNNKKESMPLEKAPIVHVEVSPSTMDYIVDYMTVADISFVHDMAGNLSDKFGEPTASDASSMTWEAEKTGKLVVSFSEVTKIITSVDIYFYN